MAPLLLLSLVERVSREVLSVEGPMGHKHVTLGAPGVRLVTLLQDQICVPKMAVRKFNPEVGPV